MASQALVIGGAGFLGTGVVRELRAAGWQVTSLGRGRKQNTVEGVEFIQADRRQPGALARAIKERGFDLVVDCAAYQRPDAEGAVATFAGKTGHYVFMWQTRQSWAGTCRTFVLGLRDGSVARLTVSFRSSWRWHH